MLNPVQGDTDSGTNFRGKNARGEKYFRGKKTQNEMKRKR